MEKLTRKPIDLIYAIKGSAVGASNLLYQLRQGNDERSKIPDLVHVVNWHVDKKEAVTATDEAVPLLKSDFGIECVVVGSSRSDLRCLNDEYPLLEQYEIRRTKSGFELTNWQRLDLRLPSSIDEVVGRMVEASMNYDLIMFSFSKPIHSAKPVHATFLAHADEMYVGDKLLYDQVKYTHQEWWDANLTMLRDIKRYMVPSCKLILDTHNHGVPMWRYLKKLDTDYEVVWDQVFECVDVADYVIPSATQPEQRADDEGKYDIPKCLSWLMQKKSANAIWL